MMMSSSSNNTSSSNSIPFLGGLSDLQDEKSKSILFGNFPHSREINASKWDKMLKFWQTAIFNLCRQYNSVSFSINDLKRVFTIDGLSPLCLERVIKEMEVKGQIIDEETYQSENSHQGWTVWALNKVIKTPISWAWGKIVSSSSKDNLSDRVYILKEVLKEQSEFVIHHFQQEGTKVIELNGLLKFIGDRQNSLGISSIKTPQITIDHLIHEKKAVIFDLPSQSDPNLKGVKLGSPSFDETDVGILRLQITLNILERQQKDLENAIEASNQTAKEYLKGKQRELAKKQIIRQKNMQKLLDQKIQQSHTISELLIQIDHAQTNKEVLATFQTGVSTLKKLQSETPIEEVDDVMQSIQEVLTNQEEIDNAISYSITPCEDEEELEEELKKLMLADEIQKTSKKEQTQKIEQGLLSLERKEVEVSDNKRGTTVNESSQKRVALLDS